MLPDIDYVECHRRSRGTRLRLVLCAVALMFCVAMIANLAIQDSLHPLLG
jgi:type II secretory pathway component PulK